MRTTLALDDDLVTEAQRLTGTTEKTALVRQALRAWPCPDVACARSGRDRNVCGADVAVAAVEAAGSATQVSTLDPVDRGLAARRPAP